MARPIKETIDYFPHYVSGGKTLFILESDFGNDGYAFWFKLLETLCNTKGMVFDYNNPADVKFLLSKTHVSEGVAVQIVDTLVLLEAIDPELWQNHRLIWCQNLVDNVADVFKRRNSDAPKKPVFGVNVNNNLVSVNNNPTDDVVSVNKSTQSKVKEIKEKEIKKEYIHFDDMPHVKITQEDFDKLETKLGDREKVMDKLYAFASWILGQSEKKQKTASAYLSIVNWHKRDLEKQSAPSIHKNGTGYSTKTEKNKELLLKHWEGLKNGQRRNVEVVNADFDSLPDGRTDRRTN